MTASRTSRWSCLWQAFREPKSAAAQAIILLLFIIAVVLREPGYFLAPQFWVEEGTVFFAHAWNDSAADTFTLLYAGYWSLFENLWAILTVSMASMAHAPLMFKIGGLLVMLAAPFAILRSRAPQWQSAWAKSLGCLVVLLTPLSDELWVSTLGAKFYFSLTIALLLMEPSGPLSRADRIFQWTVIIVGSLTSPVACMLTPLFWFKWWPERTPENLRRAIWLTAALVFHLVIMRLPAADFEGRKIEHNVVETLLVWFNKCLVLPFFGSSGAQLIGVKWLLPAVEREAAWVSPLALFVALLVPLLGWMVWRQTRDWHLLLLLGASLLLGFGGLWNAGGEKQLMLYPTWAPRYSLTPSILLALVILHLSLSNRVQAGFAKNSARLLILLTLVSGFWDFRHARFYLTGAPDWSEESRKWQADSSYEPGISPTPLKLQLHPRP